MLFQLPGSGPCTISYLPQTEAPLVKVALIRGYDGKSLEIHLKLCPFSRIIVSEPTVWSQVLGSNNGSRYRFYLMGQALNPIIKWLVTPMTLVPR